MEAVRANELPKQIAELGQFLITAKKLLRDIVGVFSARKGRTVGGTRRVLVCWKKTASAERGSHM